MTVHFESLTQATLYPDTLGVPAPETAPPRDMWPRKPGVFVRKPSDPEAAGRERVIGQFGLVPPWVKSASDAKLRSPKLVTARAETVSTSKNFRDAWLKGQRCIVPMMAFFEDDLRSGTPVPTRIARVDGQPMGVAGLWERWAGADGAEIISFTLLTVNANQHALMHRYQQPGSEKRMPVILGEGAYDAWLNVAHPEKAREFMRTYAAQWLTANPVEKKQAP
jgi:putative SOS response-associated peptidase YedK